MTLLQAAKERLPEGSGWWIAAMILGVQLLMVGVFAIDPRIIIVLIVGFFALIMVLEHPLIGVGLLIVARLLSTGATVFFRVGRIGVGPFEPALVLCLIGLIFHASTRNRPLWQPWPWRGAYAAMITWVGLSLMWSVDPGDGLSELLPMLMVLANALVILAFVDSWKAFKTIIWFWVGACVLICVLAITVTALGISTTDVVFKAAESGGRETGLGQQPNWFAMNLMFIIHTCFGMVLVERRKLHRAFLLGAGVFIFVMMLKSGSRGGAYATLIGGVLIALAHPIFRRWFVRFVAFTIVLFMVGIAFDIGDSAKALGRISSNFVLKSNYRELNWLTCMQMFWDTRGLGIGAGGYETLLPTYNNYVAQSLYTYPHGIIWQVIAHYGVVGLAIMGWICGSILGMGKRLVKMAKGTEAEIFAWAMPASMCGYVCWSFVEFTLNDKPFWEFLALYTALYLVVKRMTENGEALPVWGGAESTGAGRSA